MAKNQPAQGGGESIFKLVSKFDPAGDQPKAISELLSGLNNGMQKQTLLGATGTGKTFTMANVIKEHNKPTLIIAHNKTLAAQLAQEFKEFFPDAAVHYFVSYYDYYQPEAYMPASDTFIEKDAQINKEIDRLRHASTQALLTRADTIIVASVSCIYGLGSPEEYEKTNIKLELGMKFDRLTLMKKLVSIHFERTNADLNPGQFRATGSRVEFMPVSETIMYQIELSSGAISQITKIDPVSSMVLQQEKNIFIFPAKHFITEDKKTKIALTNIKKELTTQLKKFEKEGKLLEAERIKRRTNYDLAMIKEVGYCSGIENYSRHLSGKKEGEPPETLLSYFPHSKNAKGNIVPEFLTLIDESHVTLPQLQGMYAGDRSRKETLVEYGFRLPSAKDNRPLRYEEFQERIGQVIYTSATPSEQERTMSSQIVEQIIRPTGLVDPETIIRPIQEKGEYKGQIQDFIKETENAIEYLNRGERAIQAEAELIAKRLKGKFPVIYCDERLKAMAIRFQQQLNENAKTLAHVNTFPEMNHNELEGWRNPEFLLQNIQVVYLYSDHDHERVEKRMEICRSIFEKHSRHVIDIVAEGASLLEQYYYLIHLTDWISYYISKENQVDPDPVESINHVKDELAKLK